MKRRKTVRRRKVSRWERMQRKTIQQVRKMTEGFKYGLFMFGIFVVIWLAVFWRQP